MLAKPTGAICNLDCKYCFFLSKEMLYPEDRLRMADVLLEIYIRQLLESQHGRESSVAWQGGEPTLMGLDFFRRAMAVVATYRAHGITIDQHFYAESDRPIPAGDHQVRMEFTYDGGGQEHQVKVFQLISLTWGVACGR